MGGNGYGEPLFRSVCAWKTDPHGFWADAASAIDWFKRPERIFEPAGGTYGHWFPDGVTNTCHNCLDRHVEAGRGEQLAFIYDSPVTGRIERISYADLLADVKAMAAIYRKLGVDKGDRIIIYMPMIPQAAVAMLAAARIGAVHSVVFGGFAANELAIASMIARRRSSSRRAAGWSPGEPSPTSLCSTGDRNGQPQAGPLPHLSARHARRRNG